MAQNRFQKILSYLQPYKERIGFGVLALLIVNALGIYLPLLIRDVIDSLEGGISGAQLTQDIIFILVLTTIMWGIRMVSRVLIFGVGRIVEYDLKQNIFSHLLTLEPSYFATHRSGDLINRATSDVDSVRRLVGFALLSLVNTIFAYALTLPVMLAINVKLSVLAIAVYPAMLGVVVLFSRRIGTEQKQVQEKLSALSELIQEDLSGISLIKIYSQEKNEQQAFGERNRHLLRANLKLAKTRNFLFPVIEGISYVSLLVLLTFGTGAIFRQEITVGDFIALLIFVERLVFPTALMGFTITSYQRGEVSIERIEEIIKTEPQIKDASRTQPLAIATVRGQLEAKNLSFTYPQQENPALNKLSFTIAPGETIAVVGPIGSGKSTLANTFPRLLDVAPGQLFLDGVDITQLSLQDLRQAIAYVPQDSFLFSTKVKHNIAYGVPDCDQSLIEKAAQQSQIHPEILNFPQQYDTIVGERGITLSGGQRQRTALARALVTDAPVLILDDALSSVDNQTATAILEGLSPTRHQKTVIFISHQLSATKNADRIFVMDRGEIVQVGTHEELLHQGGLYGSLWQQHQLEEVLA